MAPAVGRLERPRQRGQAELPLLLLRSRRRRDRRQPAAADDPEDTLFQRLPADPNRRRDVPAAKRHPMIGRAVEEIWRGENGLIRHVGPGNGHRRPIGHHGHQRQRHFERIGKEPQVLVGLDVQRRGAPFAPAQIFKPRQQRLLHGPLRADDRPFTGLALSSTIEDLVARLCQRDRQPRGLEPEPRFPLGEFQRGNLAVDVDQRSQPGDRLAVQLEAGRRTVAGHANPQR